MDSTFGGRSPDRCHGRLDERLEARVAKGGIVAALEADRRGRLVGDPGAPAHRPPQVARPDLDLVRERRGGARARSGRCPRRPSRASIGQVRSRDVADEQRVAGQDRPWIVSPPGVTEQERGVLGAVARRVDGLDRERPELQDPAVGEGLVRVLGIGELVDVDRRPGRAGQPAVTRRRGRRGCGSRARARCASRAGG